MASGFIAHLNCPLCGWASVSSSPSYSEAQRRVAAELLEHMHAAHPKANEVAGAKVYDLRTRSTAS